MRWEDERYVRFYTRNTPEWLSMSWHARGLMGLLMRSVDRAGVLPLGRLGLKGVAAAVQAPWSEIEAPLRELIEDGCVRFNESVCAILIPNFLEAQEARQSDRARQAKAREATRSLFDSDVTGRDSSPAQDTRNALSRTELTPSDLDVTARDQTFGNVTPSCAVLSRTVPNQTEEAEMAPPLRGVAHPGVLSTGVGDMEPPKPRRGKGREGRRMVEGWQPRPETLAMFRAEGVDAAAHVLEFVDYWLADDTGQGTKRDWEAAFRNRIRSLIGYGRAKPWAPPRLARKPAPEGEPVGPPSPEQAAALGAFFDKKKSPTLTVVESRDSVGSPERWKPKEAKP